MRTIKYIVDEARAVLQDARKAYWTDAELLAYANGGRLVLYATKPRLYEVTEPVTLQAGTLQSLPNGSEHLFTPLDNLLASSRRGITMIDEQLLVRARPRWRAERESDVILHVIYRESSPRSYEVYPPAMAGTQIRLSYARPPAEITLTQLDDPNPPELTEEGSDADALIDYVLHRAYGKQADTVPDAGQLSGDYLKLFMTKIAGEDEALVQRAANAIARSMRRPQA